MLIQFNLVYGLFGQSNMHSKIDFSPRQVGKETNDHYIREANLLLS